MRKMQILVDEYLYHKQLENGLNIYIHPKKDFVDYHAALQVGMGGQSIDYFFEDKLYTLPAGCAHFLEHIMFENRGVNISDLFAEMNADINASTSRDVTKYYFSAQEKFEDILSIFLNHFSTIQISDDTIEKEREIIIKEIKMYEDNMFYQVHDDLIKHMYQDEKIWQDIAGTEASVKHIDRLVIEQAINHFYQANNMTLILTGPFDPQDIFALIEASDLAKMVPNRKKPVLSFNQIGESNHHMYKVNHKQSVNYMAYGIKIDLSYFDHLSTSQKRLAMIMFFEYYFGESSKNYQRLKDENLINYSYYTSIQISDHYGYFILASESKKPKKLLKRLDEMVGALEGISERLFLASKRSRIGHFIGYFDNAHSVNSALSDLIKKDIDIQAYIDHVSHIRLDDVNLTKASIRKDRIYSVIYAKKA